MHELEHLFENNRQWVARIKNTYPGFFDKLSQQQAPQYLWIGCADSRVPANEIVGLLPGELFVHRNVSNLVVLGDPNCLTVIQYAVDVLNVQHIIVCGHYGCGGIQAVLQGRRLGLSELWLTHVRDVKEKHREQLEGLDGTDRGDRLCELNVIEQVINVSRTVTVQDAWLRKQDVTVHGWIYGVGNGLLRDLGLTVSSPEEVPARYTSAIQNLSRR